MGEEKKNLGQERLKKLKKWARKNFRQSLTPI